MSDRGRSRSPKPLSPPPKGARSDVSMSRSRSRSPLLSKEMNGHSDTGFKVIVVSGLSKNVMKGHLDEIFGEYGQVTGVDLPLFKISGLNRGKAAIEFSSASEAQSAVKHMNDGQLDGSFLKVVVGQSVNRII
ncbi:RNA-binding protein with serine-rich domain 1, partial [Tremellales sp. Uapishka_1]